MKVSDLAARIGGVIEGDAGIDIRGVASLKEAQAGDLSFLANPRYAAAMTETLASAVIVGHDWNGSSRATLIRVDSADGAFARAAVMLAPPPPPRPAPGVHPTAVLAPGVVIGEGVSIGPWCVCEPGVRIGARTILMAGCYVGHQVAIGADGLIYPHVTIRENTMIGDRVILHPGVVVGSDGFGYTQEAGQWKKIPQIGHVEIGDDVELGSNTTVDRARFGKTLIGNGVKLDNLVQIAHNVQIGENTVMAAQCGIAGSAIIGRNVQFGGHVGMVGHIKAEDNAIIGAKSLVTKDVDAGTFVFGYPAMPHLEGKRLHALTARLPQLRDDVADLKKKLAALEARLG